MSTVWVRKLADSLRSIDIVKSVLVQRYRIVVRYTTGNCERFWFGNSQAPKNHIKIDRTTTRVSTNIAINKLYESDLIDGSQSFKYIAISRRTFEAGTPIEKAIAIQRFIKEAIELGYQSNLPYQVLLADHQRLLKLDWRKFLYGGTITFAASGKYGAGRDIIEHCFDLSDLKCEWRNKIDAGMNSKILFTACRRLQKYKRQLTSRNLLKLVRRHYGPRIVPCKSYEALFRTIGVSGSVYDPHPFTGSKAIACAMLGIKYITDNNPEINIALDRGLAGIIGLKHEYFTDVADWVIVDWNFSSFDYESALGMAKHGKRLMIYVPSMHNKAAIAICRPDITVGINVLYKKAGSYFVW